MKIKLFIESAGIGGAERMVLEMLSLLRGNGVDASFLGVRKGWLTEEIAKREIPAQFIESTGKLGFIRSISAIANSEGVNLIHSHSLDTNFYTALASKLGGFKHLATEHGDVHHSDTRGKLASKLGLMKFLGTEFNSVSHFSKDKLIDLGVKSERISTIPNPIDLNPADYQGCRERIRTSLGIPDETWVWIHVANLRPVKDQETLIRGFASSYKANPIQTLLVLGDGDLRESLEELAQELGVEKAVRFLGFQSKSIEYLAASDGFILSSLSEAMPMSLLEAASMELVLVGSKVGGIPEVISDKTGYLFESKDSEKLANVISQILQEPTAAKSKAQKARELMLNKFSAKSVCNEYIKRYQQILG